MTAAWTRREVLKTIAATAGSPMLAHAAPPRRTVAIIGGGMAGVSVAWLLDGQRDVVLLESRIRFPPSSRLRCSVPQFAFLVSAAAV
jgi:NADPH-dependent glutamate synthase beta subunit-like oxidoreductase